MKKLICPSILSADFACLGEECEAVLSAGADWIHVDVMDQHFVPNLTIGPVVVKSIRKRLPEAFLDTHLMIKPVDPLIVEFVTAGASLISFHPEATLHIDRTINLIRANNVKVGMVLNPATSIETIMPVLHRLDLVLLMSVNPGFGGQKFIPYVLEKAEVLRKEIDKLDKEIIMQIDGGVTVNNIAEINAAGIDSFVAGSAIFNTDDYVSTIASMRKAIE